MEYNKIELLENDSILAHHSEMEEEFINLMNISDKDDFMSTYQESLEDDIPKLEFSLQECQSVILGLLKYLKT